MPSSTSWASETANAWMLETARTLQIIDHTDPLKMVDTVTHRFKTTDVLHPNTLVM